MVASNGVIVSRDRAEIIREVRFWCDDDTADHVRYAQLPADEKLHVERHRAASATRDAED